MSTLFEHLPIAKRCHPPAEILHQVPAAQGSQEMVLWEPLPKDLDLKHGKNTAQGTASPWWNCRNHPKIYGGFDGFGVTSWGLMTLSIWWLDVISKWKELWKTDYEYSTSSEVTQNKPWGFLTSPFLRKVPLGREMKKPHCGSCSDWTDLFLGVAWKL